MTTKSNSLVEQIHNRMPVILLPDHERKWLSENGVNLKSLLHPFPAEEMEAIPVQKVGEPID